ncbi:MAG: leucine-rich repeat protein [Lachnospiraceae bacterium]|nr:leucine-rich repeat protein [Lachnospiraceae bacterium]
MFQKDNRWNLMILLLIIYLALHGFCIRAKADGFQPGGAWELDIGKEINTDFYDEWETDGETISAEGQGIEEYSFPVSFDPRNFGLVSEVKDQGRTALCWDYAAVSCAESELIKDGYDKSIDLSEYHGAAAIYQRQMAAGELEKDTTFAQFCQAGGNPLYIWQLWQEGYGPAMEDEYPGMDTVSENTVPEKIDKGAFKSLASVWLLDGSINVIKREISQNGAVVGLYYSYGLYYNDGVNDKQDSSYYMPYPVKSRNHAVSIVGWDDDFPAESFEKRFLRTERDGIVKDEPLPNGAWLVKNSWGKRAYKGPEEGSGYYWISYYDKSLSDFTSISFEESGSGLDSEKEVLSEEEDDLEKEPDSDVPETKSSDTDEPEMDKAYESRNDTDCGAKGHEQAKPLSTAALEKSTKQTVKQTKKKVKIKGIIYTIKGGKATVKGAVTKKRKVKIPAAIRYQGKKYPVTKIGEKAFAGNKRVRKIILGKNIRSIGKEAFSGCRNLKTIIIR